MGGPFTSDRPLIFIIRGAFVPPDQISTIGELLPDFDVALTHLPGMHTPYFTENSAEAFAAAFDETLATLGRRDVLVVGLSLGGAVAMAMRSSAIRGIVLVDTPMSTAPLWMLPGPFRQFIPLDSALAGWIWDFFGVSETEVVNRDYQRLLSSASVPIEVLVASEPLGEPRPISRMPGFVSDDDVTAYRAAGATVRVMPNTGHDIPGQAAPEMARAVIDFANRLMRRVRQGDGG